MLRELTALQHVAAPLATFTPIGRRTGMVWTQGETYAFHLKLFGVLSLGVHTIEVIELQEKACCIYTHEYNDHVPVWNHRITLEQKGENQVAYTDEVELYAGWKTPFVYLWAGWFYAHRQRRWRKRLLKKA